MPTTTSRLLTLLSLLQARRDWPGGILAERLGISHRTVRRDVDRLRELGYTIRATKGPDGGYRLDAGADLPPLLFDDDQAIAIAVALRSAALSGAGTGAGGGGVGIGEAALRALTTVRQVMPSRLRHRMDALDFSAIPNEQNNATPPVDAEVLLAVAAAVHGRETLRFDYARRDAGGEADKADQPVRPPRRVEPHHLVVANERWYLVAWEPDLDDWRIFRVDRIVPRTPNGRRFVPKTVPGGDVQAYVSARFKGSTGGNEWPCRGSATLHLPTAAVLPFAGDAVVDDLGDGRCRIHLGSWSWVALAASLGRFDAEVSDAHPEALAEAFGALARRYEAAAGGGVSGRGVQPESGT